NDDIDLYRVRSEAFDAQLYFQRRMSDKVKFGIGPGFQFVKIIQRNEANYLGAQTFNYQNPGRFATLKSYFKISLVDSKLKPQTGLTCDNTADYYHELAGEKDRFVRLSTDLSAFGTPNIGLPLTVALRLVAQTNIGDYKF